MNASLDGPTETPVLGAPATLSEPAPASPVAAAPRVEQLRHRLVTWALAALLLLTALATFSLWQKLANIQELLARQSADASANAIEARALAKQALDQARETATRQAVQEARLSEVALQRSQLEELMQSLSRSRDENLVVDIESAVRLAQQQAQLTGSVEPMLAALRTADQRLARAAQPRLTRLRNALGRDIERIKTASVTDLPALLGRLDDLVRQVDELPLANAVARADAPRNASPPPEAPSSSPTDWWPWLWAQIRYQVVNEARKLVRVGRIETPESALLSPEQSFFLRENLKLKLLNARLGVLARQTESARADLTATQLALSRYFDPAAKRVQMASAQLQQAQTQLRAVELPRIDETLSALTAAAAGR
jgi:uroporphyrin-III C-methyltransferase